MPSSPFFTALWTLLPTSFTFSDSFISLTIVSADCLSKHSDYPTFMPLIRPFLFWAGDTSECPDGVKSEKWNKKQELKQKLEDMEMAKKGS